MQLKTLLKVSLYENDSFDFIKAIQDHLESDDYHPYENDDFIRETIGKNIESGDDQALIQNCYQILKKKPFDIESHVLASKAASRLNKKTLARIHHILASRILDIILQSGDGASYESAYRIYHPQDEMAVFNYLNKYPESRINHEKNCRFYDIYTFQDGSNLFFDVTRLFEYSINQVENGNDILKEE